MPISVCWFRRDLRLEDNHALHKALTSGLPVLPIFIFDREILDELPAKDARVEFLLQQVGALKSHLEKNGKAFWVGYGRPIEVWKELVNTFDIQEVFCNHDYEPYAEQRDQAIGEFLQGEGIGFNRFKDQVIFEKEEILTNGGKPYTVFTPYSKKWMDSLRKEHIQAFPCEPFMAHIYPQEDSTFPLPSLEEMGFTPSSIDFPSHIPAEGIIRQYDKLRNFPAKAGTSRLGIHLRFGTISIRSLVRKAIDWNRTYLKELIWREFYMQILWNFPYVVNGPFKKVYAHLPWVQDEEGFERWKEGKTGFPIVDAGYERT